MEKFILLTLLIGSALCSPAPPPQAGLCQPFLCRAPNCRCASTELGGTIPLKDIPQLVMVTFDDAVTALNYEYIMDSIGKYKNPDGCEASTTLYVSHEYTDYSKVHELWADGHEIALHSITHSPYTSYWRNLTVDELIMEFADQHDMISHFAGIPYDEIKGMRLPLFQLSGENSYKAMLESGLEYDSSWPTNKYTKPGLWPYTLDYLSTQDCSMGHCPQEPIPGAWVQPILTWQDENGSPCSMVDACVHIPDNNVEKLTEWMKGNFHRIYDSNRAPFGVHLHAAWFQRGRNYWNAFLSFLDYLKTLDDVFLVRTDKVIEYVKSPVPVDKFDSCAQIRRPTCNVRFCPLMKKEGNGSEERYMTVCTKCPKAYPWLGDPFGDGIDTDVSLRKQPKRLLKKQKL